MEEIDTTCPICHRNYNATQVIPVLLPCQHHICQQDASDIYWKKNGEQVCPECGKKYDEHLGPDKNLLRYLKLSKTMTVPPVVPVPREHQAEEKKYDLSTESGKMVDLYLKRKERPKVILIGDSGVGKTVLFLRFQERFLDMDRMPMTTIGAYPQMEEILIENRAVPFTLIDTAGQERFHAITKAHYRTADAVLLCFDVSEGASFDSIPRWLESIQNSVPNRKVPTLLVGTKADLHDKRQVRYDVARNYASQMGLHYVETSAFKFRNVDLVFETIVKVIIELKERELEQKALEAETASINGIIQLRKAEEAERHKDTCWKKLMRSFF
jgi:small GTP-binding protein